MGAISFDSTHLREARDRLATMVKADVSRDYYADLEVAPTASEEDIKKAFRSLGKLLTRFDCGQLTDLLQPKSITPTGTPAKNSMLCRNSKLCKRRTRSSVILNRGENMTKIEAKSKPALPPSHAAVLCHPLRLRSLLHHDGLQPLHPGRTRLPEVRARRGPGKLRRQPNPRRTRPLPEREPNSGTRRKTRPRAKPMLSGASSR